MPVPEVAGEIYSPPPLCCNDFPPVHPENKITVLESVGSSEFRAYRIFHQLASGTEGTGAFYSPAQSPSLDFFFLTQEVKAVQAVIGE